MAAEALVDAGRPRLLTVPASLLAAGGLLLGLLVHPSQLPAGPVCLFRFLTGLPCPGCGLTRSFCALLHGEPGAAWSFNPFGYLLVAGALFVLGGPLFCRMAPGLESRLFRSPRALHACIALAAAMFVYNLVRMAGMLV
jgi:hypothetical protein